MQGERPWAKPFDTAEILPLEPIRPARAAARPPTTPPEAPINVIDGERTSFRMPDPAIAAAAALIRQAEVRPAAPAAPAPRAIDDATSPEFAALIARVKASAPRLRALAAAGH
jgi:hypothetical protein